MSTVRTLKARYVFPARGEPIADGAVTIADGRIVRVGKADGQGALEDLGNVALLPGFVNAHTHLDLSQLDRPLGAPGDGMAAWIRRVIEFRRGPGGSRALAVERGLRESIAGGVTTLGDIVQPGGEWPATTGPSPDATRFLELIAPTAARVAPMLKEARRYLERAGTTRVGLSPHAPYTVHPDLLAAAIDLSAQQRIPLAFHLAESPEELQLLDSAGGPIRELLEELGGWEPSLVRPGTRSLDYLRKLCGAHRALVIHGNYLDAEEIALLGNHAARMAVVYCPRTHARFGHRPYPLEEFLAAGATVAVGTDSRASSPDLSVLAELRFVARAYPELGRDVVLELGTLRAARALGLDADRGSLEPGKRADLVAIRLPGGRAADPYTLWLDSEAPVIATWTGGARCAL
jgi:cytosine/adenosine deaminase-related metal-dependent hydrolase